MIFNKYKERGAYHYDWYKDNTFGYKDLVDSVVAFCKGHTLDVGCGDGVVANLLASKGYQVVGIDNDKEGLILARDSNGKALFQEHDIAWPLDGTWDYMACLNVIEHLENPKDIARIFKENIRKAAIIITDEAHPTLGKYHTHEFTKNELMDLFKDYKPEYFEPAKGFIGVKVWK